MQHLMSILRCKTSRQLEIGTIPCIRKFTILEFLGGPPIASESLVNQALTIWKVTGGTVFQS
jgi:hypothetical protein